MGKIAMLSFRLGGSDGVSVVARLWSRILLEHGWNVVTVAGEGPVDRIVSGLEIGAVEPPMYGEVEAAIEDADVVIVENLLTIPMNLPASTIVAEVLRGRPALLHHHDPPWQRSRFRLVTDLPVDDPAWRHVTINRLTQRQYDQRGISAQTIYNPFDTAEPAGRRDRERARILEAAGREDPDTVLISHPVRAIARKNVPAALSICSRVAIDTGRPVLYWLPGPAEEGYAKTLETLMSRAPVPVVRAGASSMPDLYAASDLVVFPSEWEGFGNVPVEASIHRRPVVVGDYPVAAELIELGFSWFAPDDRHAIASAVSHPSAYAEQAAHNRGVAEKFLSVKVVGDQMKSLFEQSGWSP
ncbi:MAG: glycosyltransferase family 4 protein [Acidimicrobiales bacterium]